MADKESLRRQVEALLPSWQSWYPSIFDAAVDLGLLRARVCAPSRLLLSSRHADVQSAAEQAHREQWGGDENLNNDQPVPAAVKPAGRRRPRRRGRTGGSKSGGKT